jgi:hypothetical protein
MYHKGYQMPKEKIRSVDYSLQYYNYIQHLCKKLLQLKNIKSALRQTQFEFLEKYKSPYYWAPFTLLQNRG